MDAEAIPTAEMIRMVAGGAAEEADAAGEEEEEEAITGAAAGSEAAVAAVAGWEADEAAVAVEVIISNVIGRTGVAVRLISHRSSNNRCSLTRG